MDGDGRAFCVQARRAGAGAQARTRRRTVESAALLRPPCPPPAPAGGGGGTGPLDEMCFSSIRIKFGLPSMVLVGNLGCRGLMVKAWQLFVRQFDPYPRAIKGVALRCSFGCRSESDGRIHQ